MKIQIRKQRGRPIYVAAGEGTISLVPEVRVIQVVLETKPRMAARSALPYKVYVIDAKGVTPIRIRSKSAVIMALLFASMLLGVIPLLWAGRKVAGHKAPGSREGEL